MSRPTIAPSANPPTTAARDAHSLHGVVPVSVVFFFLVGFLSIYLLRDLVDYLASGWLTHRDGGGVTVEGGGTPDPRRWGGGPRGLDTAALAALPVRRYSSLKGLRPDQDGAVEPETECAVCIADFDDDDPVRLLTACRHTFHRSCIDQWLALHPTCPVCRRDLRRPPGKKTPKAGQEAVDAVRPPEGGEGAEQP